MNNTHNNTSQPADVSFIDLGRVSIELKYLSPTDSRGSRVKATARNSFGGRRGTSVTVGWDYGTDYTGNYQRAVSALIEKLGDSWHGTWAIGHTETGAVAVLIAREVATIEVQG